MWQRIALASGWSTWNINIEDEELIKAKQKTEYNKICMDSCERILKQIQSRGWDIKNAIEWRKFVDGAI